MFRSREKSLEEIARGSKVDVLLCQPPLTLRIAEEDQAEPVKRFFKALHSAGTGLLGDDPFEPNNGLLYLAASLRKLGYSVAILDFHLLDLRKRRATSTFLNESDFREVLARFEYRVLGISVMAIAERMMGTLARISKELHPESPVIAGGLLASAVPELLRERYPEVNDYAQSDGLRKIVACLGDPKTVWSSHFGLGTPPRAFDLLASDIPLVPRVFTSLGCEFRCSFCSPIHMTHYPLFETSGDEAQASLVFKEIEQLKSTYCTEFVVIGNLSFLSRSSVDVLLCKKLAEWPGRPRFWCQMRLDDINERSVELLARAGCLQIAVGIETANQRSLYRNHKAYLTHETNLHDPVIRALGLLKAAGISTYGYFIIGVPGEAVDDVKTTISFLDELLRTGYLDAPHLSVPVPYPGTEWYSEPRKFGLRIRHHRFEEYWMNCDPLGYGLPVIDSEQLVAEVVLDLWLQALDVSAKAIEARTSTPISTRLFNW